MRVGVVGCGYWGSKHVRVLQALPEVEHVVVIDPRETVRAPLLRAFPGVSSYSTLEAALEAVDAVVVATPPASHAQLGRRAIAAGKHVLIEKPLATSVADARELITAAGRTGVTLMVGHTFEYNPAVRRLRDLLRDDTLGRIYYLDSARLNLGLYQSDVNVLWDLAPHDVSIMNYLLGSTPTAVEAWGANHAHTSLEDVAYLRLHYGDVDVNAQIHVSWLDPCKVRRVTVVGSRRMAVYNDLNQDERLRVYDKGVVPSGSDGQAGIPLSYRYGDIVSPYIDFEEPLVLEDRHFVESVLHQRCPSTDGASGLAVVETLAAAEHAIRTGAAVDLGSERNSTLYPVFAAS